MASSSVVPRAATRFLGFALSATLVAACGAGDAQRSSRDDAGAGGAESSSGSDRAGAPGGDDGQGDGNENGAAGAGGDHTGVALGGSAGSGGVALGGSAGDGDDGSEAGAGGNDTAISRVGVHIDPEDAELGVYLGSPKSVEFDALADYEDDSSAPATGGTWSSSDPELAIIDQQGRVTATAARGGTVTIRYVNGEHEATATLHVSLSANIVEGAVSLDDNFKLDGGLLTADGPEWEYPEDETVFPARMQPPKFQWQAGDDAYFRLRLQREDDVSITIYTSNTEYQPSASVWAALGGNYAGMVALQLEGKQALSVDAPRHASAPRHIVLADAALSGAIYSFETGSGLQRLDLPAAQPTKLFPEDQRCRSCHSPSRDGSLLSFQHDGGGANPGGIYASASGTSLVSGTPPVWGYSTFSPDAQRLVGSNAGALTLYDISTASSPVVEAALELDGAYGTQPSWSPDGSTLAFIARPPGDSDWTFDSSGLYTATWDRQTQKFGAPTLLSAGAAADASRDTVTSPNWSPDSRYLVVGNGTNSYVPASMALALVDVTRKSRTELSRASSRGVNETPSFAPRAQGGFYWVVFTSNRAYGHSSSKRQLWVTALDTNAEPGADASHPAFWLPGQATEQDTLLGQWAPPSCVGRSAECSDSSECCAGLTCNPHGNGKSTCGAVECATLGQPCDTNESCCAGAGLQCRADLSGTPVCQP
jgi:hypothetical protein